MPRQPPRTHGHASHYNYSPEYEAWTGIKGRCTNPKDWAFKHYGGRGIAIYKEWSESFESFLAHVGYRPTALHTIDRIDNNRGYEPGNVRWATRKEQAQNRRSTRFIEFQGKRLCLSDWAREVGISIETLRERISKWGIERALTTPKLRK